MGCDIHMLVELKTAEGWQLVRTIEPVQAGGEHGLVYPLALARNYERFARLANVRGSGPAPKGLPDNVSAAALCAIEENTGWDHSRSWMPIAEAAAIFLETEVQPLSDWARENPADFYFNVYGNTDRYRLLFGFDN